jgi:hypothetical protein
VNWWRVSNFRSTKRNLADTSDSTGNRLDRLAQAIETTSTMTAGLLIVVMTLVMLQRTACEVALLPQGVVPIVNCQLRNDGSRPKRRGVRSQAMPRFHPNAS